MVVWNGLCTIPSRAGHLDPALQYQMIQLLPLNAVTPVGMASTRKNGKSGNAPLYMAAPHQMLALCWQRFTAPLMPASDLCRLSIVRGWSRIMFQVQRSAVRFRFKVYKKEDHPGHLCSMKMHVPWLDSRWPHAVYMFGELANHW